MQTTKLLSIKDFADEYGLDYRVARRAVKAGQLPTIRLGNRNLIPRAALERVMACEVTSNRLEEKSTMTNP